MSDLDRGDTGAPEVCELGTWRGSKGAAVCMALVFANDIKLVLEMSDEMVDAHRRGSRDSLLLHELQELLPTRIPIRKPIVDRSSSHFLFRCYIIISMTFVWTGYTIAVRYTRSTTPPAELYSSTTVVLMSEIVKLLITIFFLFHTNNSSFSEFKKCISEEFIGKPVDLIKMSVPSIVYAIQNNLDFIALSNLDAGTYQVTAQLKVVTTAIFMMLILGRRFSFRRWLAIIWLFMGVAAVQVTAQLKVVTTAIFMMLILGRRFSFRRWLAIIWLFMGVAAVQVNTVEGQRDAKTAADNYLLGLMAVLLTCVTAGFAGVYFEMMLKDGTSTPLWIRNLQMYSCGVVSASVACYLGDFNAIVSRGFFHGYNYKVVSIIGFLSVGGIYISLVMKYLDNLYKSFASAVSIILVVIISLFIFDNVTFGFYFLAGSTTVCAAVVLYNSVDE
uniref:UDP-galactose/UDP-N-acetylglucosamine transporter srf-3 n=1 Tax=Ascaris lumbricoides TaxID=6252 RepID=A0A0M3HXF7_ASCLU